MDSREIELLLTPIPMSDDEKEFRQWLKSCQAILAGRKPDEIAQLAILADFKREVVYMVLSTFQDAMDGTHVDGRARMAVIEKTSYMERSDEEKKATDALHREGLRHRKFLKPLWIDLASQYGYTETA